MDRRKFFKNLTTLSKTTIAGVTLSRLQTSAIVAGLSSIFTGCGTVQTEKEDEKLPLILDCSPPPNWAEVRCPSSPDFDCEKNHSSFGCKGNYTDGGSGGVL